MLTVKEIGWIERYGSGIQRIKKIGEDYGIVAPVFEELNQGFHIRNIYREKELKELNVTLEEKVETRTSELIQSNRSLKILLDNTGQGILFFESDLEVDSNYSSECVRFFSGDISGKNVKLYPN